MMSEKLFLLPYGFTPLCPAGHLPLKGGDQPGALTSLQRQRMRWPSDHRGSISPLEGEMSGRTEGGAPQTGRSQDKASPTGAPQ
jgi:cobaltochelatase CobN